MNLITLDFETYYDKDFSLGKLTTEEYVRGEQFETIGVAVKVNDGETEWASGTDAQLQRYFNRFDWANSMVAAHNCLTGDHEVRTKEGWVRLDALADGATVLQWDAGTSALSFVQAQQIIRKPYIGKMYEWDTNFHKGVYTPDHRMYVGKPELDGWRVATAAETAVMGQNNTYVPTSGVLTPLDAIDLSGPVVRVMEMLRADANISKDATYARMKLKKHRKIARAATLLHTAGIPFSMRDAGDHTVVAIRSCPQLLTIKTLLGPGKVYGSWLLNLPVSARDALIDELQYWDGVRGGGVARGDTTSKQATVLHSVDRATIAALQDMAALSGYTATAKYDIGNTRGISRPDGRIHCIRIRPRKRAKLVVGPKEVDFSGTVYCLSVSSGAFLVRRNGATWVTGNCLFDGAILSWRYGIRPKALADTLSMARAIDGTEVGGSLAALVERYQLGEKGTEVVNALGKHRADFTPEELARYGDYCVNDVELTYKLFHVLGKNFPKDEMKLIDLTLRMFTEPVLELDRAKLVEHLEAVRNKKQEVLLASGTDRKTLMSNPKFAALLKQLGVVPPMKTSPATGKETFAFAKSDAAFKALEEHPDPAVQAVVAARLKNKSTLEETRTERFIGIAERGNFPVPLKYHAAHTGRWGGCLVADTMVQVYDPEQGYTTKRITDVLVDDLVWDGEAFVAHEGVVFSGYQEVIEWDGVTGTPEHVVFTDEGEISLRAAMQGQHRIQTPGGPDQDQVDAARQLVRID